MRKPSLIAAGLLTGLVLFGWAGTDRAVGSSSEPSAITPADPTADPLPALSQRQNPAVVALLAKAAQYLNAG